MVAGKIGAVADRKVRMASKTAGAAEKLNGGSGKMEDAAEKTEGAAKRTEDVAKKTEDVCDKFAPMSQVVETRVARLLRKRAMCKWSQNKLLGMAENATMAAVFT